MCTSYTLKREAFISATPAILSQILQYLYLMGQTSYVWEFILQQALRTREMTHVQDIHCNIAQQCHQDLISSCLSVLPSSVQLPLKTGFPRWASKGCQSASSFLAKKNSLVPWKVLWNGPEIHSDWTASGPMPTTSLPITVARTMKRSDWLWRRYAVLLEPEKESYLKMRGIPK